MTHLPPLNDARRIPFPSSNLLHASCLLPPLLSSPLPLTLTPQHPHTRSSTRPLPRTFPLACPLPWPLQRQIQRPFLHKPSGSGCHPLPRRVRATPRIDLRSTAQRPFSTLHQTEILPPRCIRHHSLRRHRHRPCISQRLGHGYDLSNPLTRRASSPLETFATPPLCTSANACHNLDTSHGNGVCRTHMILHPHHALQDPGSRPDSRGCLCPQY